ncbi:MAG: hypothetical protein H7A24_16550 [Leptospiraceae bacterium]|nr:hypothetical protein [Leptospiraceae bacterium]MCP5513500.1 hypothetical protein [Leptospiraceae bacterium]
MHGASFSDRRISADAGSSYVQLSMMLTLLLYLKVAAYPKSLLKKRESETDPTSLNICSEMFGLRNLGFFVIDIIERMGCYWGILLEAFL